MKDNALVQELSEKARIVRRDIVQMIHESGTAGHYGGSLSCADILTCLYFHTLKLDPRNPRWDDRDRFVLSKGHAAPALYAVLLEAGYFSRDHLSTFKRMGSILQGHPDMKVTPGVEMSTGSLGQGLSVALGMALAGRLDRKGYRVYVLLGDGEIEEGSVWEAAMAASHYGLDNLSAILDRNCLIATVCRSVVPRRSACAWSRSSTNGGPLAGMWFLSMAMTWHRFSRHCAIRRV